MHGWTMSGVSWLMNGSWCPRAPETPTEFLPSSVTPSFYPFRVFPLEVQEFALIFLEFHKIAVGSPLQPGWALRWRAVLLLLLKWFLLILYMPWNPFSTFLKAAPEPDDFLKWSWQAVPERQARPFPTEVQWLCFFDLYCYFVNGTF